MENMQNCTQCMDNNDMQRNRMRDMCPQDMCPQDNCSRDNCSSTNCKHWAIGMGYVPWQNMSQVYEPAQALRAGTLFPELEKPFYGSMRRGARR